MESIARFFTACAAVVLIAAAPLDIAILDGSRNSHAYQIVVRSDGAGSIAAAASAPRAFTIPKETVDNNTVSANRCVRGATGSDYKCSEMPPGWLPGL